MLVFITFIVVKYIIVGYNVIKEMIYMKKNICDRLKQARKNLDLSQEYVAKQLGVHRTTITAIELGTRKITSDELDFFSKLYGVTLDELMYGTDEISDVKMFARSFSSLSENDKKEIINLMEFKRKLRGVYK